MRIHDISVQVSSSMLLWPGDEPIRIQRVKKMEEGSYDNLSEIKMGVHTGTHIDAPWHFLSDGSKIESIPLDVLIGPACVILVDDKFDIIDASLISNLEIPEGTSRILFKTRNSKEWEKDERVFNMDYVGISADAARELIKRGVRLVGLDYLSISPHDQTIETHRAFLESNVVILETINLSQIEPGNYTLFCLPLKLENVEGSPVRAILIEE